MGFGYFSIISNKKLNISDSYNSRILDVSDDFFFWLSGFTDG